MTRSTRYEGNEKDYWVKYRTESGVDEMLVSAANEEFARRMAIAQNIEIVSILVAAIPWDQVADTLEAEGYPAADVEAALNSLIDAGPELDQPDGTWLFTPDEVDVLRRQLRGDR
jgi:hypothetical protein